MKNFFMRYNEITGLKDKYKNLNFPSYTLLKFKMAFINNLYFGSSFHFKNKIFSKKYFKSSNQKKCKLYKNRMKETIESKNSEERKQWFESILSVREKTEDRVIENWKKTAFNVLQNTPFPSKNDESWKLTDLSNFFKMRFQKKSEKTLSESKIIEEYLVPELKNRIIFIDGHYQKQLSNLDNLENKINFLSLDKLNGNKKIEIFESMLKGESGMDGGFFSILNIACLNDIFLLEAKKDIVLDEPIHLIFIGTNEEVANYVNSRILIIGGEKSSFKIIQHHSSYNQSKYFENSATNILLKEEAKLDFSYVNEISEKSCHISSIHADLNKNSKLNVLTTVFGGFMSRISLGVDLNGVGAYIEINGASITDNKNINDFHSRISHNYPECKSSQNQKNLVSGKGRSVFAGKIQVQHGSTCTEADQLCKTLLLSPESRIDSLPILEINNEDVKCTHGATVSDLDQNQVFYFQSRGVSIESAKFLLTLGFIQEIMDRLPPGLRQRLSDNVVKII